MGDRGHELLEHTADLGLRVWAPSLEELFAEAAVGLVAVMGTGGGEHVTADVTLSAPDLDALFVDWLSEVLYLFEAKEIVPTAARVRIDRAATSLDATIDGVRASPFRQRGPGVKAITYHGLQVGETEARVYLDV